MTYELTEKEAKLTRMLLIEELDQVNQLTEESDRKDKKELFKQKWLKCYDKNDLNVKEIPNARLSESMETSFCPYCMRMEFIKEGNVIRTCKECGRKYFIKF